MDLSNWLTTAQTCAALQISPRTLDNRCKAGTGPERQNRPRVGLKPEAVYRPEDVERLSSSKPHVMAESSALVPRAGVVPVSEILAMIKAADQRPSEQSPRPPALYLTLPEASAYTGLTMGFLRRLIAAGKLQAIQDVFLKVRRSELDDIANPAEQSGKVTGYLRKGIEK